MTITGTEQRIYGTLVGNCQIYLDRFAIVLGSESESPSTASSVLYGSDLSFYQCGFEYNGNFSLLYFLSLTALTSPAAFEARICKNDNKRIVIETYGDTAATQAMSLWFNTAKSAHMESSDPNWVKLNSVASGNTMAYATTSYIFKENVSTSNGSVVIDCCKKCPTCNCLNCYICDRLYLKAIGSDTKIYGTSIKHGYGKNLGNSACVFKASGTIPITSFCPFSMTLDMSNYEFELYFLDDDGTTEHLVETFKWYASTATYDIIAEYKIGCDKVTIWSYLDDGVVSVDSNIAGKIVTTYGYPFEIESFDTITNKLTINRDTIPFRSISSKNTNAFRYDGPLLLSTTITLGKICRTEQRILGNYDIACPLWLPTGNTRVKIKFTLTHDAPTISSFNTNGGMYHVRCGCTGKTGYTVFRYHYYGEDTKNILLEVDFSELNYEYYTYNTGYIFYFAIIIEYENCDGAIPDKTLSASIEILDVYDGCTGESLLSSLPQFNTIALQYPNRDGISFTATFSSLDATTNPVTTSTFDFDYLKNCTSTALSFTGCKSSFVVFSPLPLISDLWIPEKNISFAQDLTSTPDSKCFPGSVSAEDYEDFTWEIFATTETPVNTMIGKDPTIEFYEDVYYKEQINTYEVSVKTGDIYLLDQKYLKSSNASCITLTHNIIGPMSSNSRGCEFNGKAWFPAINSTTDQAGILSIEPSDTITDLEIDGVYYKYGFIPCLSAWHTTMAVYNGNLYALDVYGIKLIASDGSYTTLGNPGDIATEISLVDGHLFFQDKQGGGVSGTVATPDDLPISGNYYNVTSTNTLWYHPRDIAEYNGWRNSGLPPQSWVNFFQIMDFNWDILPQYNLFPRIPYLAHGSNYHKIEYNGELFCFDMNYNDGDISPRIAKAISYPTIYSGQGTYLGDIYRPSTNWNSTSYLYVHDNVLYVASGYDDIGQLLMYDGSSTLTPVGNQYPACTPVLCSYGGKLLCLIAPTSEKPINIISLL